MKLQVSVTHHLITTIYSEYKVRPYRRT